MTVQEAKQILQNAFAVPFEREKIASGCGRAYVCIANKEDGPAIEKAAKSMNLIYHKKGAYGVGLRSIYVGYDNCDGNALGRARAIAEYLNNNGVKAYMDCMGD